MAVSTVTEANALVTAWKDLGATYSLHTAHPGAAGTANEASGGGYARKTTTWGTVANGTVTGSQLVFDVVAGTYPYMCRWNGTTLVSVLDTPDATVNPAGQVKVTPSATQAYALPA